MSIATTFNKFARKRSSLRGHWNIGKNITLYGANAMSWAVNIHTKRWGWIHFTIPLLSKWSFCFYVSPNATPWACTYYWGKDRDERIRAQIRKFNFGHNFNTDQHWVALRTLENKFEGLRITEYDIECFGDRPESE